MKYHFSLSILPILGAAIVSTDGRCGGELTCPQANSCCSQYGFCGTTTAHCGQGCQTAFSFSNICAVPASQPKISTDGTCGGSSGFSCPQSNSCCSQYGYCGTTTAHCGQGCQVAFSFSKVCAVPTIPQVKTSTDGTCGGTAGSSCPQENSCCSQYGYCGTTTAHCGQGCQTSFSFSKTCALPTPTPPQTPQWKIVGNDQACSAADYTWCGKTSCCSQYGFCGTTSAFCDDGCQVFQSGFCNPPNRNSIQSYSARKLASTDTPPSMNGSMLSSVWAKADWTPYFIDLFGTSKPNPSLQTRSKILWDKDFVYFGIEMVEPQVWTDMAQKDSSLFLQNNIEVFIDTGGQGTNYLEFELNALKTTWTLTLTKPYSQGGQATTVAIPGLKYGVFVKGTLNNPSDVDQGWSVEMAIPMSYLKTLNPNSGTYPPKINDQWRINMMRVEWGSAVVNGKIVKSPDTNDFSASSNWIWSAQASNTIHDPSKWGYLKFVA